MRKHEIVLAAGWVENPVWRHFASRYRQDPDTRMGQRMIMVTVGLISSVVAIYTFLNGGGWWGFLAGCIALAICEALSRLGHMKELASVGEKYPRYICPEDARHIPTFEVWEKAFQQLVCPPRDDEGWLLWPAREVELAVGRAGGMIPNATSPVLRTDAEWIDVAREALKAISWQFPARDASDLRMAQEALQFWLSAPKDLPASEEWRARVSIERLRDACYDITNEPRRRFSRPERKNLQSKANDAMVDIYTAYELRDKRGPDGPYKIKQDVLPTEPELTPSLPGPRRHAFAELVELLQSGTAGSKLLEVSLDLVELLDVSLELLDLAKRWDREQSTLPRSQTMRTSHALCTLEGDVRRIVDAPDLLRSNSTRAELLASCRAVIGLINACFRARGHLLEQDVETSLRALRKQIDLIPARTA